MSKRSNAYERPFPLTRQNGENFFGANQAVKPSLDSGRDGLIQALSLFHSFISQQDRLLLKRHHFECDNPCPPLEMA